MKKKVRIQITNKLGIDIGKINIKKADKLNINKANIKETNKF